MGRYIAKRNFSSHRGMVLKGTVMEIDDRDTAEEYIRLGLIYEVYDVTVDLNAPNISSTKPTGKPNRRNTVRK
jgi:hypothetical protein